MVNLLKTLFGLPRCRKDDQEIAELVRLLRNLIPIADSSLDNRLEADQLRRRFGVSRIYPGVA